MKILFVGNSLYAKGNGLAKSARVTMRLLREAGHEVRALTMVGEDPEMPVPDYPMKKFHFPLFQKLIESQGYCYADSHISQIREAVAWADVVHLEDPFVLEWKAGREARRQGKACVGTYHLHPENILYNLGMGGWTWANDMLLRGFRRFVFDSCSDLQCPSMNVLERMKRVGFKGRLHYISNGIELGDNVVASTPQKDPYLIICIGRISFEKSPDTLVQAMSLCRHKDEIQFFFAGQGQKTAKLKRIADKLFVKGVLKHRPRFEFCTKDELKDLARRAYLAVHCAVIEVEGLSIMEAVSEGAVPVVAEGPLTAASQFALSEHSKFPQGDAKALAEKIDWWIEHPEERLAHGPRYVEAMKEYEVHKSISRLIAMYEKALEK